MANRHSDNFLLANLSSQASAALLPHLSMGELEQHRVLRDAGETVERVYFPVEGVISLVIVMESGHAIETAMIGRYNESGGHAAINGALSPSRAIVQIPGKAFSIAATTLRTLAQQNESIQSILIKNEQVLFVQSQQTAGCNALHTLEERLSRWLLLARDFAGTDSLPLTQEFLSNMLGVRRTSVTLGAGTLQAAGLIRYRRGAVHILNVEALQEASCECYRTIRNYYSSYLGWKSN